MAKPSDLRRKINALLDEHAPLIQAAFMASIADIRSQVTLKLLVERLERGDIAGALDALNLERAAFGRVENAIAQAYNAGGTAMTSNMPTLRDMSGARIVVRFDVRNPRAEEWLRTHSSQLVTNIIDDQRTSIRAALEQGLSVGRGPKSLATELAGRVSTANGRRMGGLIGLSSRQTEQLYEVRAILSDPARIREFFILDRATGKWKPRYKLTSRIADRAIVRAIKDGKALDAATVQRLSMLHSNKLLVDRAKTIARTETLTSIHAAKHEGFRQGLEKTNYPPEAVTRVWRSAGDGRVRHTHSAMNGQIVQGLDTPFVSPSGARLRYPGDTGLGAGAEEVINCRCDDDLRIDFSWGVT